MVSRLPLDTTNLLIGLCIYIVPLREPFANPGEEDEDILLK